jgi:N-acetylmuramic acid 6-phosphate etherase/N-acetylglucosamine-6-phosphate deacetylase
MIISAPRIFSDGAFGGPGAVVVENGLIAAVLPEIPGHVDIRLEHGFLSPGLIDLHNNGAFGVDFCTATPAQWDFAVARLAAHGVTSFLPTIITAPFDVIHAAASRVAEAAAAHPGVLGLHLEGPFLAAQKRGAHRAEWLQGFSPDAMAALLATPALRVVTLAPELPGALAAIRRLVKAGVMVSLGHTDATAAELRRGVDAGARLVTHVFNAQSAMHHRAPGAPGVALTDERLFPCLIADGLHVDPMVLKLAFSANDRAIAVTDSILVAGMEDGFAAEFGGENVRLQGGAGRRPDGTMAGAGITLDEGVRRLISAGIAPEIALGAVTDRPAKALNLLDRGRIAVGCRGDLVWWDDAFAVQRVWLAGHTAAAVPAPRGTEYARPDLHDLDERESLDIVKAFLAQEAAAQRALAGVAPQLAELADAVGEKLRAGGRLFYVGAGTSGRLALLDAVECGPTFGIPDGVIIPLLAGGEQAFLRAVEGAEDDAQAAVDALMAHHITQNDALVGIAASGRTPFTLAAVAHANAAGALTGAIVNNLHSALGKAAHIAIEINSGPEVIAGSTRLAAGTAQKIALNILSSTVMIRLGKVYGPYMVDVRATNEKLRQRAMNITATVAGVPEASAEAALAATKMQVKTAIVMLRLGVPADLAAEVLRRAGGSLRKALNDSYTRRPKL